MRYDDLTSSTHSSTGTPPKQGYPMLPANRAESEAPVGPLPDREVPLPNGRGSMVLDQWLDGEATDAMLRATVGGNDALDLWTKIDGEAELLRSRTTPLYVHKRIMESLPDDMYQLNEPWYRRPVTLNPITLLAAATALLGIGILVSKIVIH
jgi:hypothetical protein